MWHLVPSSVHHLHSECRPCLLLVWNSICQRIKHEGSCWGTLFTLFHVHPKMKMHVLSITERPRECFLSCQGPEGSLQICPILSEGEGELSLMGRVGSDGLWFVPIDSQPFHLLPDECVRGLCRAAQNTGLTREFSSERKKKTGEECRMLKNPNLTLIDSALTSFVALM